MDDCTVSFLNDIIFCKLDSKRRYYELEVFKGDRKINVGITSWTNPIHLYLICRRKQFPILSLQQTSPCWPCSGTDGLWTSVTSSFLQRSWEHISTRVQHFMKSLLDDGIKVKLEEWGISFGEISYLGQFAHNGQLEILHHTVDAFCLLEAPINTTEPQRFVGLRNFCRLFETSFARMRLCANATCKNTNRHILRQPLRTQYPSDIHSNSS